MLFKRGKRRYKKARLIFIWIPIATPWHSARSHKTIMFGFRIPPLGFLRFEQRSRSKRRSRNITTTPVACIYRRFVYNASVANSVRKSRYAVLKVLKRYRFLDFALARDVSGRVCVSTSVSVSRIPLFLYNGVSTRVSV